MSENLFEGLKVIDLTNNYAGPCAGAMLADYGAEVWHIERPVFGDDNRYFPPIVDGVSLSYCTCNRGKKSVTLDLKDPRAVEVVKKMAQDADILLESFRPGVMARLGLSYDVLHEINPRLIYCSISAYGQTGPYANRPGYDVIAQAVSGLMEMTGEAGGPPMKIGVAIGDWLGSLNAFATISAALYYRDRTGKGQWIDVSLSRTLLWIAAKLDHHAGQPVATRSGNHHTTLAPYGIFSGNNGETLIIATLSDKSWSALCQVMGRPELAKEPRFITNDQRVQNRFELIEIIESWLKSFDHIAEAEKLLMDAGVPCAKVYNQLDIDQDPHYNECGWLTDMPVLDRVKTVHSRRVPSNPFSFSEFEATYGKAAELGQHNHELLESMGYTAEEVDAMEAEWEKKAKGL